MEDQGAVNGLLGIEVTHQEDGTISLTQSQLIESILQDLHLTQPNVTL